jgi:hypothetical protein
MTIDDAITDLSAQITAVSPKVVLRIKRRSAEEAAIRAYAPAADEAAIKALVQPITLNLLTEHDIDLQVLVYDIATSLPPSE